MPCIKPPKFNDDLRLDEQPGAICLSISFPNYRMFYKKSKDYQHDWVVLLLKPSILWELDCKFYRENAASNNSREVNSEERKQPNALREMFGDYEAIQRQTLGIPKEYTTNPQAEVLVFDPIPIQYINRVIFFNKDAATQWMQLNPGNYSQKFYQGNRYFLYRMDCKRWQT
jgi:ssDNA thymidine ADP-ribosyltransferase, DarT